MAIGAHVRLWFLGHVLGSFSVDFTLRCSSGARLEICCWHMVKYVALGQAFCDQGTPHENTPIGFFVPTLALLSFESLNEDRTDCSVAMGAGGQCLGVGALVFWR